MSHQYKLNPVMYPRRARYHDHTGWPRESAAMQAVPVERLWQGQRKQYKSKWHQLLTPIATEIVNTKLDVGCFFMELNPSIRTPGGRGTAGQTVTTIASGWSYFTSSS